MTASACLDVCQGRDRRNGSAQACMSMIFSLTNTTSLVVLIFTVHSCLVLEDVLKCTAGKSSRYSACVAFSDY
jgi:hypothetical protein